MGVLLTGAATVQRHESEIQVESSVCESSLNFLNTMIVREQAVPLGSSKRPEDSSCANLVSMTRPPKSKHVPLKKRPRAAAKNRRGYWLLQDAKARFSELVRKVRSEGPQHVTVHGRDEVVVIAAEDFRRLKGDVTGQALIEAMQASPYRDIGIEPKREPMPVRDISL